MRTAARMPRTAKVRSSSMRVRAGRARLGQIRRPLLRDVDEAHSRVCLVQSGCFGSAGIGCLVRAAAEQLILLLQQLFNFPQLADLVGPLFHGIGKGRQSPLWLRAERAVKT